VNDAAILRVLAPQIADLRGAGDYVPPFEFMITDADCRLVCGLEMNTEGVFRPLPETPNLLRARFPVSVLLVDSAGKTWKNRFPAIPEIAYYYDDHHFHWRVFVKYTRSSMTIAVIPLSSTNGWLSVRRPR
jgi:hypothetical protein